MARYISFLKNSLQEKMGLQTVWTVVEASSLALKAERIEKSSQNFYSFRRYSPQSNFDFVREKEKRAVTNDSSLAYKGGSSSAQQGKSTV